MEAPSNGGLLYHEVQEAKLCAVHCVNTVLQGPFFSEVDLAALASDLDLKEQQMMLEGSGGFLGDFLSDGSYNVSMGGDFSIQVLQKALEVWDLQVIPLDSPVAEASKYDPELENAFICHLQDHWFCIRKINGEWYNFNSLYPAPEHLSKFYLSAYLDSLKGSGWSIFLVRGNFPKECPIPASDANNGFGQWLTPDDAKRITASCNQLQVPTTREPRVLSSNPASAETDSIAQQEEQDLRAAIAASLLDFSTFGSVKDGGDNNTGSSAVPTMVNSASGIVKKRRDDDTGSSKVPTMVTPASCTVKSGGDDDTDSSMVLTMENSASGLVDNDNMIHTDAGPDKTDELRAPKLPSSVSNCKAEDDQ